DVCSSDLRHFTAVLRRALHVCSGTMPPMDDVAAGTGTLWTIGHSTREWTVFTAMLSDAGIQVLVDVRRFAGSRRNPQFSGETMARTLPEAGFRSEEHTSELQSRENLVCHLLLEK